MVIPLLNEEESLRELTQRLHTELLAMAPNGNYEILFIDDGSTDTSFAVIEQLRSENSCIRAVRFRRNYGKSAALAVAFARAQGEFVFTMDADLQDDPAELPALLAKLHEGYDLVSGWKRKRYDPWHKTFPSKLFNAVTSWASGIKLHDFNCGLKAYRRDVIKSLDVYGEMHRYLPALAHWMGFRVTEMPVQHHARKFGVSKFGISRFLKGYLDLLTVLFTTRFLRRPMHLLGGMGTIMAIIGVGIDGFLSIEWALGRTNLSNRPLALFGVLFIIVGVQLISLGLLGEMFVKNTTNRAAGYLIRDEIL